MSSELKTPPDQKATSALVVGIGSAAGGIDALKSFFSALNDKQGGNGKPEPSQPGLAYVVVQHLDMVEVNVLTDVVAQFCPLPVVAIGEETPIEVNHVYLAPSHCTVKILEGERLSATQVSTPRQRASVIDTFFQSLGEHLGRRAVGIVLSGAGNDGTLGLKAINDGSGMVMAQQPDTATHSDMPRSAISTGNVDHVLAPEQMSGELDAYRHYLNRLSERAVDEEQLCQHIGDLLPPICDVLLDVTEHDFRHYKSGTLIRRVLRRMQVLRVSNPDDYLERLRGDRDESRTLFRELLISVTSFFRDPDTFATLSDQVIPQLFEKRSADEPIRVWVPGCATGEEAYTLAILLFEARERAELDVEINIFATDIDDRALRLSRNAEYPLSIHQHLSETRLKRFFVKKNKQYQVVKEIRELCVFSVHNLISDPPFSQLDLISCRNLLIYLGPHLQQKLIPVFHFGLKPNGYLLLGPSENLISHTELFRPLDKKHRISQRKPVPIRSSVLLASRNQQRELPKMDDSFQSDDPDIPQIAQRILLDEFSPRYAVVDADARVICTSAGIERFLEFPDGNFQNSIVKMARSGLRSPLRATLREACETKRKTVREDLSLPTETGLQRVRLIVQPMPELGQDADLFMVVFELLGRIGNLSQTDGDGADNGKVSAGHHINDAESIIEQLEQELARNRADLESTVQDLEGSNEELKSSNEELLSMNEELQSANEELETSKEEIQAGMEALSRAQADLENLLNGTRIATIFLDRQLNIKSFTPSVTQVYNIKPSDLSRPLSDITHNAEEMPILPSPDHLMADGEIVEDEIQLQNGEWYLRRVLPYKNTEHVAGMILTFVEISELKKAEVRLATEHAVNRLLADARSMEDVNERVLEEIRLCLQARVGLLWLHDETGSLHCQAISAESNDVEMHDFLARCQEARFGIGEGLPGTTWKSRQIEWREDVTTLTWFGRATPAKACGLVSGIAVPIILRKECLGVLEFFTDHVIQRDPLLVDMLTSITAEIGSFVRRKRLKTALEDEAVRKAAVLNSALDCIITMDISGQIVDFNPAAEETFGYTAKEVVGQALSDVIIPAEYRDQHRNGLKRFLKTGESDLIGQRIEITAQRKDGVQLPVELAINVTYIEGGRPFFTGYLRDISQRREHEAALRDSEAKAQALIDASAQMVWATTSDGEVVEDSPSWRTFTGQTYDEFKGFGWVNVLHPDDRQATTLRWREAVDNLNPFNVEYRVKHVNGEWRWTSVRAVPQIDVDGSVLRWVGMNTDITEQKRLQNTLARNSQRLSMALKAGGMAAWEWTESKSYWSQELYELLGLPENTDPCSENFFKSVHPDDLPGLERAWEQATTGNETYDYEFRIIRPDGEIRWLAGVGEVVFDKDGHVTQIFGMNWDVTDERQVADAIRESERRAQQASLAKSEFLANMSHEIRTPMTAVLGYTDLLAVREDDAEKAEFLRTIKRNGNFLLEIINDILDLSKIEAGKMELLVEPFAPHSLIADVRSMMLVRAGERNLEFEVEFDGPIPETIESDSKRLRQILINLIGNAIKFTKAGKVQLVVRSLTNVQPAQMRFDVIDTGIGMTEEQLARIFQAFAQADASVTRDFGGTGLGLTISQRLANMLGGAISVVSKEGAGSTFSCTIEVGNIDDVKLIQPQLDIKEEEPGQEQKTWQLSCRVLVVDDRRDVRFLARHLLVRSGAEVEFAEDGLHAVEYVSGLNDANSEVDLILLDMQMPRMDGYETAIRLRELGYRKPIIALTADAMHGDMNRCLTNGCDAYLSKPIDANELLAMVAHHTQPSRSDRLDGDATPAETQK